MSIFSRRKRTVPTPEVVRPHTAANPMFAPPEQSYHQFRWQVLGWTAAVFLLSGVGFIIYGPWYRIETVSARGTVVLNPRSVKHVADTYLNGQQWLVLPRRNLLLLNRQSTAKYLRTQIERRLSIEDVSLAKHGRHDLIITITERTPLFQWDAGQGTVGVIDRHGVVISMATLNSASKLPVVHDLNKISVGVNTRVAKPEVIDAIISVQQQMAAQNIPIESFAIPVAVCPVVAPPAPEVLPNSNNNGNINGVNTNVLNRNTNQAGELNSNQMANVNGFSNVNVNANAEPPCDLNAMRLASQEIRVKIKDGPDVYIDRHQSIQATIEILNRVLRTSTENMHATYIDMRFLERVYIR